MPELRVGLGFDSHPRAADRPLFLAGILFEDEPGLGGHSDGDVVVHAVADALLGAAALGDLGQHFPDTDPALAGIAGNDLLRRAVEVLSAAGFVPVACDAVVVAATPAVGPRRDAMRANLARGLGTDAGHVSVKATRPEGLSLTGDGIACLALATVGERG